MEKKDAFFQVVADRRSIRDYTDGQLTEDEIKIILESARLAPSGENAQPWRFIVVKDEEKKKFLAQISKNGSGRRFTGEYLSKQMQQRFETLQDEEKKRAAFKKLTSGEVSAFVDKAHIILIVIGKKDVWDTPYDCSASIENILLAVTSLDLGACWVIAPCIDVRDELKLKAYFDIPDEYKVISIIPIGRPSRIPRPRPRISLEELVFAEKYGEFYYQ